MDELRLRPGMFVLSCDGQKLGRLARIEGESIDVVRGRRAPRGFAVPKGEILSQLRAEIFLRQRLRDYLPRYEPRREPAPRRAPEPGAPGRRFRLFRRVDARW